MITQRTYMYPFQMSGILTETKEICLTDSRIDSTKSESLTFLGCFFFIELYSLCDVGERFWCAKLPNNISINFAEFSYFLAVKTSEESFSCWWNLILRFFRPVLVKFRLIFGRSNSLDGLTWHVTRRLLEFRIFDANENAFNAFFYPVLVLC